MRNRYIILEYNEISNNWVDLTTSYDYLTILRSFDLLKSRYPNSLLIISYVVDST